ncbi:MAG: peptidyl-prolyl cis-trans isomerase [Pseudomonadales bacterium]|nr:peptidyl-prolyl cis-trans isomerase [Pseudomonadales bacterium]
MKRFFTEPLMQFFFLAGFLFIVLDLLAPQRLAVVKPFDIAITEEKITEYLQFQRKSFNASDAATLFSAMSELEKQTLHKSYVRDEVLFREALALGLNENDEIIRRRLIQKMEYIAQGFYDDIAPIDEAQLEQFFIANSDLYTVESLITFTHIFVSAKTPMAQQVAQQLLNELNAKQVTFAQAGQYGERFLYSRNYIERTPSFVASHFGEAFQQEVFALAIDGVWQGPLSSDYGWHLILVKDNAAARMPELVEVAPIVLADMQREQRQQIKARAIEELVAKYTVVTEPSAHSGLSD